MKILDALNTPSGRSLLLASLWLFLIILLFILKMAHVEIEQEGRTMLADMCKGLLAALIFNLGGKGEK